MEISNEVRAHLAAMGRKGGQSRSRKKRKAVKKNLERARAARWKKKRKMKNRRPR